MSNRETTQAGPFNMVALALLAIVICAVAVLLMPAHAGTEVSAAADAAYANAGSDTNVADAGYLPAQVASQGKDAAPVVDMTY
ncbi:MAG TPA: hypothetical protein VFK92_11455 [Burkholderiales bacterium]|nr:hypothetical protein [Burkholderiales bacterium]